MCVCGWERGNKYATKHRLDVCGYLLQEEKELRLARRMALMTVLTLQGVTAKALWDKLATQPAIHPTLLKSMRTVRGEGHSAQMLWHDFKIFQYFLLPHLRSQYNKGPHMWFGLE